MKKRTMYSSKEEAERLNPYVVVFFNEHEPAAVFSSHSCKKVAENYIMRVGGGTVLTRKQAEKEIKEWNEKRGW